MPARRQRVRYALSIGEFSSVISPAWVAAFNWCPSFFSCFCLGPKIYGQLVRRRKGGRGRGQERPTQSVSLSAILSGGSPFWHQQNHRRLAAPFSFPIILFARSSRPCLCIILSFSQPAICSRDGLKKRSRCPTMTAGCASMWLIFVRNDLLSIFFRVEFFEFLLSLSLSLSLIFDLLFRMK